MSDERQLSWLVLHTFAGEEPKGAEDIWQTCSKAKRRGAVRSVTVLPLRPGHVLVRAEVDAWSVIRLSKRITGYQGVGDAPIPIGDEEAQRLLAGL
jgi:transcription antitermination factor NusG